MKVTIETDHHTKRDGKLNLRFEDRTPHGSDSRIIRLSPDELMETYAAIGSWSDNFYEKDDIDSFSSGEVSLLRSAQEEERPSKDKAQWNVPTLGLL